MFTFVLDWLNQAQLPLLGILLMIGMIAAAVASHTFRQIQDRQDAAGGNERSESQESYIVSAVLGLLALLLGFTFSLATDRFEARRGLVLEEANAISTAFLRTQLLDEPHRARLSKLLIEYVDNKIALGKAADLDTGVPLLAADDKYLTDIWTATSAAFVSIKTLDFSSTFVDSMNNMIELDAARRSARQAHVPTEVFAVLLAYLVVSAGVLGYVLSARRGWLASIFLMGLLTVSLLLIIDIDRPTSGGISESQRPRERLRDSLKSQPTSVYDRLREPQPQLGR